MVIHLHGTWVTRVGDSQVLVRPDVPELDAQSSDRLRRALDEAVNAGRPELVVDLGQVEFIDLLCIGMIAIAAVRQRAHGGEVVVQRLSETARRALAMMGYRELLTTR